MSEVVRARSVWVAVGTIALAVVLLVTLAPARDVTHTVLGWLRVTPLDLDDDDGRGDRPAPTVPTTPTPTLADVIDIVRAEASATNPDATSADIDALPFDVIAIDPPEDFGSKPTRSVTTFGTVTLGLNTADLAELLAPGFPSRRLARRLGTDEITVAGGALVVSSWPSEVGGSDALVLYQIEAPLVSGLPPRDLELLAELVSQAFVPPILSREINLLDTPLVQMALGLEVDDATRPTEPSLTELPSGDAAVSWMRNRSQLVLTGSLAQAELLELAASARVDR